MESTRSQARWAGLLYGMTGLLAPFAYLYVPGRLLVPGDALATADRVRAAEGLLRAAIAAELFGATFLLFAALALHRLFERVDRRTAGVMLAMMLVSVPISYVNALNHLAALVVLRTPAIEAVLDPGPLAAQVALFLRLHNHGLAVNQILWGLWLFPIGILVLRSGFFPRWLAWPLFAAGGGYVANSLGALLLPPAQRWITANLQALGVGEIPFFVFYLLIWGVRGQAADRIVTLLVLALVATGAVGLGLLVGNRIDPVQYAGFVVAKLVLTAGLAVRWHRQEVAARATAERA